MTSETFKRKLSAILSADVKSYSRLMREDETGTIKTLTAYREMISMLIQQHHGRVVDSVGDNLLAEFDSVVDAVQGAVAIQKEVKTRNADLPETRRMVFRIGINLGDLVVEGDRIYGDGVNLAARLEALADPGGICISRTAFDQIEDKLPLGYEYLGEMKVKNAVKPLRAYKVIWDPPKKKRTLWGKSRSTRKRRDRHAFESSRGRHPGPPGGDGPTRHAAQGWSGMKRHLLTYLGVIGLLFVINVLTWPGLFWFHWPALGWGLLLYLMWVKNKRGRQA